MVPVIGFGQCLRWKWKFSFPKWNGSDIPLPFVCFISLANTFHLLSIFELQTCLGNLVDSNDPKYFTPFILHTPTAPGIHSRRIAL